MLRIKASALRYVSLARNVRAKRVTWTVENTSFRSRTTQRKFELGLNGICNVALSRESLCIIIKGSSRRNTVSQGIAARRVFACERSTSEVGRIGRLLTPAPCRQEHYTSKECNFSHSTDSLNYYGITTVSPDCSFTFCARFFPLITS